jgi:hypothetical protein
MKTATAVANLSKDGPEAGGGRRAVSALAPNARSKQNLKTAGTMAQGADETLQQSFAGDDDAPPTAAKQLLAQADSGFGAQRRVSSTASADVWRSAC